MNEMRKLMETLGRIEEDDYYGGDYSKKDKPANAPTQDDVKKAFIDGWEWALKTPWTDQMKSEEHYELWASGKDHPEDY